MTDVSLPERGEPLWDTKLNNSINALAAESAAAAADAANAVSTANQARQVAQAAAASQFIGDGDAALAALIETGEETAAALSASTAQKWKPDTAYLANTVVQAPDGTTIIRLANGASRASFDATEEAAWKATLVSVGSVEHKALVERDVLNILDFGVSVAFGATASQSTAIQAALDDEDNYGKTFRFPPGIYRCDVGLTVTNRNSLIFDRGAELRAGAAMDTLLAFSDPDAGYAEDFMLYGGTLNGNLLADKIMTIVGVLHYTLAHVTFIDGVHRGLVTTAGNGAELIAYDLRFHNTTTDNVADNIAIEANMGDSHYRDIIVRDWTVGVKDTGANRWTDVHVWIGPDIGAVEQMTERFPSSIGFDVTGSSNFDRCVSDTYRTMFKLRSGGGFTQRPTFINCRGTLAASTLPDALLTANPSTVFDNTDGVGARVVLARVSGHSGAPTACSYLTGGGANFQSDAPESYGYVTGVAEYKPTTGLAQGIPQGATTFTPTLYGSTDAAGGHGVGYTHTYTTQTGRMVVNGDEVTYYVRVKATLTSSTNFAGVLRIGGLPLPSGATNVRDGAGAVGFSQNVMVHNAVIFGSTTPYITLLCQLPTTNPSSGTNDYAGTVEVGIPNLAANQNLRGKTVDVVVRVTTTHFKV